MQEITSEEFASLTFQFARLPHSEPSENGDLGLGTPLLILATKVNRDLNASRPTAIALLWQGTITPLYVVGNLSDDSLEAYTEDYVFPARFGNGATPQAPQGYLTFLEARTMTKTYGPHYGYCFLSEAEAKTLMASL